MLHIYKLSSEYSEEFQQNQEQSQLVHKVKITKKKVEPFGFNNLEIVWTPDGSDILVSGDVKLRKIERHSWKMSDLMEFGHKN